MAWVEGLNADMAGKDVQTDLKRQADAGIQVIKLPDAEAQKLLKLSMDAGWEGIMKTSPQHGARLRQLMAP